MIFRIRVFASGEYIGEGWASGASQGHHTLAGRGPTPSHALRGCGPLGAPPRLSSVFRKLPDVIFTEEKISPDFDDIFCVGFSETKKSRKHGTGTLASC